MSHRHTDPPGYVPKIPWTKIGDQYHVGSHPDQQCSYCLVIVFDSTQFPGCPGCKAFADMKERQFWHTYQQVAEAAFDGDQTLH